LNPQKVESRSVKSHPSPKIKINKPNPVIDNERWFTDDEIEKEMKSMLVRFEKKDGFSFWGYYPSTTLGYMPITKNNEEVYKTSWYSIFNSKCHKQILIPNTGGTLQGSHWFVILIDKIEQTIEAYDSLNVVQISQLESIKERLVESLWDVTKYKCILNEDVLKQPNTFDCGVYGLIFAKSLLLNCKKIKLSQKEIKDLRLKYPGF
uniref:ULP_PROTEASE domain-containing protein n=1 Tax=Rhabditophanes sp. KR3021 TaxID=114890 RepID=A0AC35U1K3_9BILA